MSSDNFYIFIFILLCCTNTRIFCFAVYGSGAKQTGCHADDHTTLVATSDVATSDILLTITVGSIWQTTV